MKHTALVDFPELAKSLPVRERGLKLVPEGRFDLHYHVAPRAGAWIEAHYRINGTGRDSVAPRAGAWIEAWPARAYRVG